MRRIPVFISVCILAAICITVAACVPLTIVAERNRDDVVREVTSMGYDEILFIGGENVCREVSSCDRPEKRVCGTCLR